MNINKWIFYTIFEILSLTLILVTTAILWNNFDLEPYAKTAYSYAHSNNSLLLNLENHLSTLVPTNDTELTDNNKLTININNPNKTIKNYNLYFVVNNNSSLNLKYLKFKIGNDTDYIINTKKLQKKNENYYLIKTLQVNEYKKEELYLWLDFNSPNEEQGKLLTFRIIIEEI